MALGVIALALAISVLTAFSVAAIATNLISVYKGLGGGWEIRGENDFVPVSIRFMLNCRYLP